MARLKPFGCYSKRFIEWQAERLLRNMEADPLWEPSWPLEVSRVADFLDLGVVWDVLPSDENGAIAARILPGERLIEMNEEILQMPPGFVESTLAHEIGHWVLHVDATGAEEDDEPFLCRPEGFSSQILASVEWQAQYFAGCLLMPRRVLEELRQGRDLTEWQHLYQMREELGVSISNLVCRLQDLGWIWVSPRHRGIYPGRAVLMAHQRFLNQRGVGKRHGWWRVLEREQERIIDLNRRVKSHIPHDKV